MYTIWSESESAAVGSSKKILNPHIFKIVSGQRKYTRK